MGDAGLLPCDAEKSQFNKDKGVGVRAVGV
jgi:hypothetical protein